jgi:hypothetical protein
MLIFVVACGGTPAAKPTIKAGPVTKTTPTPTGQGSANVAVNAPDVGCLTATCAYHQNTATYFTCLAGGAGMCFHFGAACTPSESCMVDASDHKYKTCANPVEGTCAQYGAACAPANHCMFSFDDGLYHTCDSAGDGQCKHYGALCAP